MTPIIYLAVVLTLPDGWTDSSTEFFINNAYVKRERWMAFISVGCGLWGGLIIGYITEYYTSYAYNPT
jgi:inorganic pyrophosphatase